MIESLGNVWGLLVAILGFGAIIFIHELGHFVAARWAGIRVFVFAIGFGPPAVSWRKGIGLRRGSTNEETLRVLRDRLSDTAPESLDKADKIWPVDIGKTEYRLNWLPLGGYVQMRGQDDVNPTAAEADRGVGDSFLDKPVWKRMVVISAGVVMNVLLAAVLYIAVYTIGKPAAPAVIGGVGATSPAATAVATNAESAGVTESGLRHGDEVIEINGTAPREFGDVWLEAALASAAEGVEIVVQREGVSEPLRFEMETVRTDGAEFRGVGVSPALSTTLARPGRRAVDPINVAFARSLAGLPAEAERVISFDDQRPGFLPPLSGVFTGPEIEYAYEAEGDTRLGTLRAEMETQVASVAIGDVEYPVRHIAGFVPPLRVGPVQPEGLRNGLLPGDVFVRIGRVEWPGPVEGIRAIQAAAGEELELVVVRNGERVNVTARVSAAGRLGFQIMQAFDECVVTRPLAGLSETAGPGGRAPLLPGAEIVSVNAFPVQGYVGLRDALARAEAGEEIELGVVLPVGDGTPTSVTLVLAQEEIDTLRGLGWTAPAFFASLFEPAQITIKASNPVEAIAMGIGDTHQMILRTYLTLVRLVEGTVEVEQLRGPVGIAHIGTQVAQRSLPELLFFFAVISANLAVLNFLPIPIVDGGLMVFLLIEGITGKPVSPAVQNAATLVGLVMIGSVFLLVTFNDLSRLL